MKSGLDYTGSLAMGVPRKSLQWCHLQASARIPEYTPVPFSFLCSAVYLDFDCDMDFEQLLIVEIFI